MRFRRNCVLIVAIVVLMTCASWHLSNRYSPLQISMLQRDAAIDVANVPSISKARPLSPTVTIITAFLALGRFKKGATHFEGSTYEGWMKSFAYLQNPLVAYLETDEHIDLFTKLRSHISPNLTIIIKITRSQLKVFDYLTRTKQILSDPKYPKESPNTVVPEYSIAMHMKYELLDKTIQSNPFRTKYIAWLDIGYFRDVAESTDRYYLDLPPNFDERKVAFNQVYEKKKISDPALIFKKGNVVWVGGGFFLAEMSVMSRWTRDYLRSVKRFLDMGLVNTDQQVIHAMFQTNVQPQPSVELQTYSGKTGGDLWMHLGYTCRKVIGVSSSSSPTLSATQTLQPKQATQSTITTHLGVTSTPLSPKSSSPFPSSSSATNSTNTTTKFTSPTLSSSSSPVPPQNQSKNTTSKTFISGTQKHR